MKFFLVGGAVRDSLLGLPAKDHDWVVVGATPEEMLKLGYQPVHHQKAKDFPVFLHPKTKEEYALARREKKESIGHGGFEFDISPSITLKEDLQRRDLTINAMARPIEQGKLGDLIDPFNGKADLENQILCHVSSAFSEDPLRILRTARFASCLGFKVAPETMALMKQMVAEGQMKELGVDYVWKEINLALMGKHPNHFFEILKTCGANRILFPQIKIPGPGIEALQRSVEQKDSASIRFAVWLHDLTKEELSTFCLKYRVPSQYRDLAIFTNQHLMKFQHALELNPGELMDLLTQIDAFNNEERLKTCLAIFERCIPEPSYSERIRQAFQAAKSVNTREIASKYRGHDVPKRIKTSRLLAIQQYFQSHAIDNRNLPMGYR